MKSIYSLLSVLLCAMLTFGSCVDDDKDLSDPSKKPTTDLNIPEDFSWESTQAVKLSITSPSATTASFYCDAACTPESLIGTLPVLGDNKKTTFTFDLPFSQEAVYVRYTKADGTKKTEESKIKKTVTRAVESDDIIFEEPELSQTNLSINIPNSGGYGTIMFEDTWPNTEDYDFNDIVVNYKINCVASTNSPDIDIHVSLKIRALGGNLPYNFAMQFGTWTSGGINFRIPASDMGGISNVNSTNDNIKVEELKTEHPAIEVTGLNNLRKPGYYNTVSKEDDGVQVDFTVTIKCTIDQQWQRITSGFLDPKAFDYFLRHENGREIHMRGFAPTSLYADQYEKDVQGKGGKYYYQNNKGLVWGLKAPAEIGWPAEKNDITTVYYRFAGWVESGGSEIGDNPNLLIWYDFHTPNNYIDPNNKKK